MEYYLGTGIRTWGLKVNGCNLANMLSEVSQIRNTKAASFLSNVEDRSKDKNVHKNKHDHTQTQI
jgi:hypothetical protein